MELLCPIGGTQLSLLTSINAWNAAAANWHYVQDSFRAVGREGDMA
jgi:hypothetical protein